MGRREAVRDIFGQNPRAPRDAFYMWGYARTALEQSLTVFASSSISRLGIFPEDEMPPTSSKNGSMPANLNLSPKVFTTSTDNVIPTHIAAKGTANGVVLSIFAIFK